MSVLSDLKLSTDYVDPSKGSKREGVGAPEEARGPPHSNMLTGLQCAGESHRCNP